MVKRKSLTLAQARRSLRAFYAQQAGKRRRSRRRRGGATHAPATPATAEKKKSMFGKIGTGFTKGVG